MRNPSLMSDMTAGPDYKELGKLKADFPGVPVLALTATANGRVKQDVIQNLGIQGCAVLTQSFNRSNLRYEVRPKTKNVLSDISHFIASEHAGECGIIYCLSKRQCEETAKKLQDDYNIAARHYHAGHVHVLFRGSRVMSPNCAV
jgi:superfamily II DNA helicase RecQ